MKRTASTVITLLSVVSWSLMVSAQTSDPSSVSAGAQTSVSRQDDWRRKPKVLAQEASDPQTISKFEARGNFFDQFNKTGVPLDQPQPPRNGGSSRSIGARPELMLFPNETAVLGTFQDYQVYLSPSHLSAYTDIQLTVEQVLMKGPASVEPGGQIDLLEFGADLELPNGQTINNVQYDDLSAYSIQPSHRYVLLLEYHQKGDFFTIVKYWELEDGFVVPRSPDDIPRAQSGRSKYAGMREETFIETLREDLAQSKNKN